MVIDWRHCYRIRKKKTKCKINNVREIVRGTKERKTQEKS